MFSKIVTSMEMNCNAERRGDCEEGRIEMEEIEGIGSGFHLKIGLTPDSNLGGKEI